MKKIINNIEYDLTPEDIAQRKLDAIKTEEDRLARIAKEEQEKLNKESAMNKLKALGLNDAEIKSIIGN